MMPSLRAQQPAPRLLAVEEVRQAYGVMAEQYIELFGSTTQVRGDDLALIERHLSIRPGAVLDAGCGPGHLTAHLRSFDVDATGLDLVPEFIGHARSAFPFGRYLLGSMGRLPVPDGSLAGVLAWYSLIHTPPDHLDGVLVELRRACTPAGVLVAGFFDGDQVAAFDHKVSTAYRWPADEFAARLGRAGFREIERIRRPGVEESGRRPHAVIAALAM